MRTFSPEMGKVNEVGVESVKIESVTRTGEEAIRAVSLNFEKIMKLLVKLKECTSESVDTRNKARSLPLAIENYIVFAYMDFWESFLRLINIVQKKLQQLGLNIKEAAEDIETLSCFLGNDDESVKLIAKSIKKQNKGELAMGYLQSRE